MSNPSCPSGTCGTCNSCYTRSTTSGLGMGAPGLRSGATGLSTGAASVPCAAGTCGTCGPCQARATAPISHQSGFAGSSGLTGNSGFSGTSGLAGNSGFGGNTGLSGTSGLTGSSGLAGITGVPPSSGLYGVGSGYGTASTTLPTVGSWTGGKVVIIGSSGCIAKATVAELLRFMPADNIVLLSREPVASKHVDLHAKGIQLLKGQLTDMDGLAEAFTGVSSVFIIPPKTEDRSTLYINGINAAKRANVPFLLTFSSTSGDDTSSTFGHQFNEIEMAVKSSGLNWCIMRTPMFTDKFLRDASYLKSHGQLVRPCDPSIPFTTVAIADISRAAAVILQNPSLHYSRTYTIAGPAYTYNDAVAEFSRVMHKDVSFNRVSYETYKSDRSKKFKSWQADAELEVFKMIDAGRYNFRSDLRTLLGYDGLSMQEWTSMNMGEFL